MSVTSSGRSSISSTIRRVGMVVAIACAMFCSMTVLPDFGGRDDQAALALPIGATMSITRPVMFSSALISRSSLSSSGNRASGFEQDLVLAGFRGQAVDAVELGEREQRSPSFGCGFHPRRVAGVQIETADLRRRDVDVVGAGQVVRLGRAQEAEAVGQDFEHAGAADAFALLGLLLEQGEDQVMFAEAVGVFQLVSGGDFEEFGGGFGF